MPISNSRESQNLIIKLEAVALKLKLEHYITKHVVTYNDIC